ncbi:uncharacterized protein LOC126596700 [Malus sylvestris]|uniref:uncharacterized protein LOC126596700 n=1 Tax=Malus sylvestris TaxID=3752 RepID=UPI0021AD34B0|nr:uncharacterized protein LOC126596700 [Malus sylvestris]
MASSHGHSGCLFGESYHFLHYVPGGYHVVAYMMNLAHAPPPPSRVLCFSAQVIRFVAPAATIAPPPPAMDSHAIPGDGDNGDDAAVDDGVPAALHALRGDFSSSSPQSEPPSASGCGVSAVTATAAVAVTKIGA